MKYGKVIKGNLDICAGCEDDFSEVEMVAGYVCARENAKASLPRLAAAGGSVYAWSGATLSLPRLAAAGGDVYAESGATLSLPRLAAAGGGVCAYSGATLSLPRLAAAGGGVCAWSGATLSLPRLAAAGGDVCASGTLACPKAAKFDSPTAARQAALKVRAAFRKLGFLFADSILLELVSEKVSASGLKVFRLKGAGSEKLIYGVETPDGTFSHGATLREAKDSLLFKIGERDTSAYKGWTLDTTVSKRDAIASYRQITGACEFGTRRFVETVGKLKATYTVREIVALTRGQYGNEQYERFFNK